MPGRFIGLVSTAIFRQLLRGNVAIESANLVLFALFECTVIRRNMC